MTTEKVLRRDAQDNIERVRVAALELFRAKGLDAPLNEIAREAGVTIGTIYHRFGSREGLIDAVLPAIAGARIEGLRALVLGMATPRRRLQAFVDGMMDLQQQDRALNDAILRRYRNATALVGACDASAVLGRQLVDEAHADGSLSPDFTAQDLSNLLWLAGIASREANAPAGWQRAVRRPLDLAWTGEHGSLA